MSGAVLQAMLVYATKKIGTFIYCFLANILQMSSHEAFLKVTLRETKRTVNKKKKEILFKKLDSENESV